MTEHPKSDDSLLLARFDEALTESFPNDIAETLCDVRDRFEELISKEPIDENLLNGLSEIISCPGTLSGSDVKILETLLTKLRPNS